MVARVRIWVGVQAGAVADLLADPGGGVVKHGRGGRVAVGVAPAVGLLPHIGDVPGRGGIPPAGFQHRLHARGREPPLRIDLRSDCLGRLGAIALGLVDLMLAGGGRAPGDDRRGGECELQLAFDLLGDSVEGSFIAAYLL